MKMIIEYEEDGAWFSPSTLLCSAALQGSTNISDSWFVVQRIMKEKWFQISLLSSKPTWKASLINERWIISWDIIHLSWDFCTKPVSRLPTFLKWKWLHGSHPNMLGLCGCSVVSGEIQYVSSPVEIQRELYEQRKCEINSCCEEGGVPSSGQQLSSLNNHHSRRLVHIIHHGDAFLKANAAQSGLRVGEWENISSH